MKVLILAGGFGTRLAEETHIRPKPMAEIGGKPILWHIMKTYSHYGFNEFVILLGYKGYYIKEYFANYFLHHSDLTIDLVNNDIQVHSHACEPWKVTLLDTGLYTLTAGRIKRAAKFINNEPFMLTYGDGVSDINVQQLYDFHKNHGHLLTMTSTQPKARFGQIETDESFRVLNFKEKPENQGGWINAGFFVCQPQVLDYIPEGDAGDKLMFEQDPLENIAKDGQLFTYRHEGFWQCMDTLADKNKLNKMWSQGEAKWRVPNAPQVQLT